MRSPYVYIFVETLMLKALKSPHRISRRRPFDKLRDRLGFCLPAALRLAQAGDSPSRGSDADVLHGWPGRMTASQVITRREKELLPQPFGFLGVTVGVNSDGRVVNLPVILTGVE